MTGGNTWSLRDAEIAVREEHDRTVAERDAFDAFGDHLQRLLPGTMARVLRTVGTRVFGTATHPAIDRDRVRGAYRETVMAVPHYETVYGTRFEDHFAAECGDELADALVEGGPLSVPLVERLVAASQRAAGRRASYARTLAAERDSLADARETLSEVEAAFERLDTAPTMVRSASRVNDARDTLDDLHERCNAVTVARQRHLRNAAVRPPRHAAPVDLSEHLYGSLPTTYPVLAATSNVQSAIRLQRRGLERMTLRGVG